MTISFFCQSCGARFDVDARQTGKRGRCRKCGQVMVVPRAAELASMAAMPAASAAAVGAAAGVGVGGGGGVALAEPPEAPGSWLDAMTSSAALRPLTAENLPAIKKALGRKPTPLDDDLGDSKPYLLAEPVNPGRGYKPPTGKAAGRLTMFWRNNVGKFQRLFRWLNETAYLVSVPFLMMLLVGAIIKSRPLAVTGATVVVLLNVGRIVAGLANLAMIPLRGNVSSKKLRKPIKRVLGPVATIAAVVLAFSYLPWLSGREASKGSFRDRIRAGGASLKKEMRGTVEKAEAVDLGKLSEQAADKARRLGGGLQERAGGLREDVKEMQKNFQDLNKNVDVPAKGP